MASPGVGRASQDDYWVPARWSTIIDSRTQPPDDISKRSIRATISMHRHHIEAFAYVVDRGPARSGPLWHRTAVPGLHSEALSGSRFERRHGGVGNVVLTDAGRPLELPR